ncbi:MAG: binding-protein-dependent transport system inner membrane [Geobacteraceae bacterium]|nr:MAG: binding-protein-dependent transport system inner membrane [Geobacteraceae bacterium]
MNVPEVKIRVNYNEGKVEPLKEVIEASPSNSLGNAAVLGWRILLDSFNIFPGPLPGIVLRLGDKALGLIVPLLLFLAWDLVTRYELTPPQLLPLPKQVAVTFLDMVRSGELLVNLKISLLRVTAGFFAGSFTGLVLGTAMGLSKKIESYVGPLFHSIRQVPLLGWIPLLILWLGMGETFKVFFIAIGAFYAMTLNTFQGIRDVPGEYLEVARVFEYNRLQLFRKIVFPAALPSILTGVRIGLSLSWFLLVGAEFTGASEGIGYSIAWARQIFQTDVVIAGVFVIGVIGLLMDRVVTLLEGYLLRWRRKTFTA